MDGAETHYHFCQRCQQRVDEGTHSYVGDGQYYQCTVCGNWHDAVCTGTITATDNHDGLTHTISCSGCTLIHGTEPHDTLGLGGGCSVCGYTPQPIDPTVPVDPTEPTEPETPTDQEGETTDE